jgi:hypothetical protein
LLDIIIGHWVRVFIRLYKARGSQSWPIAEATVQTTSARYSYGRPVAEVVYSFTHQGHYLFGTHQKPFIFHNSAKEYVTRFPKGTHFSVRVNPENSKISVVRDEDQDEITMKLRARFE